MFNIGQPLALAVNQYSYTKLKDKENKQNTHFFNVGKRLYTKKYDPLDFNDNVNASLLFFLMLQKVKYLMLLRAKILTKQW